MTDNEPTRMPLLEPPTAIIDEELEAREMTRQDLAEQMPGDTDVNLLAVDLLAMPRWDVCMDDDTAAGLAHVFGTGKQFWLNVDKSYRDSLRDHAKQEQHP